jgi:fructose-bisphosphate aldolase class II
MLDADEAYFKEHGEPLFSSHMIDLSEEQVDENIETTAKYLERAAPMKQWLEMEIGITGGEEDGVNNEDVDNNSLYTQPEDIYNIYKRLSSISPYFSIAAGFGNVHGVYKPGNVKLQPVLLQKHQAYVKEKESTTSDKPVYLVFHGGSGSSVDDFREAISYGVVKVNLDTDLQWAYLTGIRDYVLNKKDYIMSQVGNPEGEDKPNKKYYDPRVWVREGEKTMSKRVAIALEDVGYCFLIDVCQLLTLCSSTPRINCNLDDLMKGWRAGSWRNGDCGPIDCIQNGRVFESLAC